MLSYLFRVFVSMIGAFVLGVIGMFVGAWVGGNFSTAVFSNGFRAQDAPSQIGFMLFALVGAVISWRYTEKKKIKKR